MAKVSDINLVSFSLEIDGERVLFILLSKDGTINRMGNGSPSYTDRKTFYIGKTDKQVFTGLMGHLTDEMLQHMGRYNAAKKLGLLCRLTISLQFQDGTSNGFDFHYGSESTGVPKELADFLYAALAVTDPWYSSQQAHRTRTQ